MKRQLLAAIIAAATLGGCVYEQPGPPYGYAAPAPAVGYYGAYYDGYYGPIVDGYWGPGATFYFMDRDHHWHHDEGDHFGRGPHAGWEHFQGSGRYHMH